VLISKAITFATIVHEKQKRKGSNIPYIFHPLEAGSIVSEMVSDEELIVAAILHDTVEDANVDIRTITEHFGERVGVLVAAQSENKDLSWKERKSHTIEFLKECSDEGIKIVTLADKLANARSLKRDYLVLGEAVWDRFNVKEKALHGWYYNGLVDCLVCLEDYGAYKEFKDIVSEIFGGFN
jgi:GTP diphosphokinase / guanosine-3',5'-bis(diphosphate) 3'-diphosphatase